MFLQNPTHCHSEAWRLDSLGLSGWLHRWKVVWLSDGWFRWRTVTAVTRYYLCPYSEYERQNILNLFLSYRLLICDFLWYDDIAGTLQRGWQVCYSWGSNVLDSIIYVLMICNIDRIYPDLVFPQIRRSIIRQNAFYVSDKVSCMKKCHQEFCISYCKSFRSDVLPTHQFIA